MRTLEVWGTFLSVFLLAWGAARPIEAAPPPAIAMVANNGSASVTVFDMNTDTVLGSVSIGSGDVLDCSLDAQTKLGYVGDFAGHIWAIDAGASPPVLAAGTNPIGSSIETEDTAITADRRFLLSCDGGIFRPVSVIDLMTRTEVSTFPLPGSCTGIEACADGSVLTVDNNSNSIRRLTIDTGGNLTDTGETLSLSGAFNVVCGKGGKSGVAISSFGAGIQSFSIPGLVPIDTRPLSSSGIAGVVSSAGDRFYVRSFSAVDVFSFDSTTGALGAMPLLTIPVSFANTFYGVDQLAVNAPGTKLYVSEGNVVNVYDTTDGMLLGSITDPSIVQPTGICTVLSICGNGMLEGGEECDDGNLIDGDGCDSNCTLTACGNGIVTAGEECDDGNLNNGDCCSSSCTAAPDATPCDDHRFCNGTDTCASGACTAHAGDPCSGGAECNNLCDETHDSCFAPFGSPCTDDGNVCTDDECDGMGGCVHPDNFGPCDDGVFCNGSDFCASGSCVIHDGDPCLFTECGTMCDEMAATCDPDMAGTPCSDDGEVCTLDQCDGMGTCAHPPAPSGTACPDDGLVCTNDQCDGVGACAHPPVSGGMPCPDDGKTCTNDVCDGIGLCVHPARPDGTACDDANACTHTDRCTSGHCVGSDAVVCTALCRQAGTCDPSSGICTTCPAGYTPGAGGCQKTYAIDASLLDNQFIVCDIASRYNGCGTAPFGFHWTDTGDASVGEVAQVDVQIEAGFDCSATNHTVTLNAIDIGVYASTAACFCEPPHAPQLLADVDPSTYAKGGLNSVSISTTNCAGLSEDAHGAFALVTVTYEDLGTPIAIRNDCRQAAKSKFKYFNRANDARDKIAWKWVRGAATTQAEVSDPTTSADYQFCIYAETTGAPALLIGAAVPASATLWSAVRDVGYQYMDKAASHDGMRQILVKGGAAGKSKIIVNGKGAALGDPTLPPSPATDIRVQLTNAASGVCWESEFPVSAITGGINGKAR